MSLSPRVVVVYRRSELDMADLRGWNGDAKIWHIGGGPNTLYDPENGFWPTWSSPNAWGLSSAPERHGNSSNILFLDGHAGGYKYDVGGNAFWDYSRLPQ